jgi:hypothetical protein
MTQQEYARKVTEHLGALQGIDETMPTCDKPCSVHSAFTAKQNHEVALLALIAQYTSNGMSTDIANKVAETLKKDLPIPALSPAIKPPKNINIIIPGTKKMWTVTTQTLATWGFRIGLILFMTWLSTGKIDRTTLRTVMQQELSMVAVTNSVVVQPTTP